MLLIWDDISAERVSSINQLIGQIQKRGKNVEQSLRKANEVMKRKMGPSLDQWQISHLLSFKFPRIYTQSSMNQKLKPYV